MIGYFEDLRIGSQADLGSHTFTAEEIVDFGRRFDPQPFHVDEEAARHGPFGELVASGWHSGSICIRLWTAYKAAERAAAIVPPGERLPQTGPSPGLNELSWTRPVRAGDTLAVSCRVVGKIELRSRPRWGLVTFQFTGMNQHAAEAIRFLSRTFVERRGAA